MFTRGYCFQLTLRVCWVISWCRSGTTYQCGHLPLTICGQYTGAKYPYFIKSCQNGEWLLIAGPVKWVMVNLLRRRRNSEWDSSRKQNTEVVWSDFGFCNTHDTNKINKECATLTLLSHTRTHTVRPGGTETLSCTHTHSLHFNYSALCQQPGSVSSDEETQKLTHTQTHTGYMTRKGPVNRLLLHRVNVHTHTQETFLSSEAMHTCRQLSEKLTSLCLCFHLSHENSVLIHWKQ